MKKRYSGDKSIKFWKRINSFEDRKLHGKLYGLGCDLQNLEDAMFAALECAERKRKKTK